MRRPLLYIGLPLLLAIAALAAWIGISTARTEREIAAHNETIRQVAGRQPVRVPDAAALQALPAPVQRYLAFALPDPLPRHRAIRLTAAGDFRRPLTEQFAPTTAAQTIAVATPALMFDATTPIGPGLWARAYDFFADGRMEMRAKIVSTLTVVDESATEALNRTSLRRWLLESPLYPMALLPGGPVRWEAIDAHRARAIVSGFGLQASMVASFRPDGSLASFDAEQDGDLSAPYHGSGEHAARSDYRRVDGVMVPHAFVIGRAAGGTIHPFWKGQITSVRFE